MNTKSIPQPDLPVCGDVFNLAIQQGLDPDRVIAEQLDAQRRAGEAAQFAAKMQLTLEECPGFIGADPPACAEGSGKVLIEPGRLLEAMPWLRRRFHVNERLELSHDQGVCIEVKPRIRSRSDGVKRKVTFGKPEQYLLSL